MIEKRVAPRFLTVTNGSFRTGAGARDQVTFRDLSETGCSARDPRGLARVGMAITVKFGDVGPFSGIVVRAAAGEVGIAFDKPIYPPIFAHLAATHSSDWRSAGENPEV